MRPDEQDSNLTFAPTHKLTTGATVLPEDMAAPGRMRPLLATHDTQTDQPRITDRFGPRIDPITGEAGFHAGIDIAVPEGSRVRPVAPGLVTFADYKGKAGLMITITHKDGYESSYLHLQRIYVRVGQTVSKRMDMGETGNTGRSTGTLERGGILADTRESERSLPRR